MAIAGHVSKRMLEHYSHIRMAAKRTALDGLVPISERHVFEANCLDDRYVEHYIPLMTSFMLNFNLVINSPNQLTSKTRRSRFW
jgi:hypothetical protein